MEEFMKRLWEEKQQLAERIVKLKAFLDTEKFNSLEAPHQALLKIQYAAMCTYWECLESRYNMLPGKPVTPLSTDKEY